MTGGSYLALSLYDFLALRYLHKKVPVSRVVIASFIANAFGHNLGFAAFTGGAFRLRLYASSRLTAIDVATVTGFTSITTGSGARGARRGLVPDTIRSKPRPRCAAMPNGCW